MKPEQPRKLIKEDYDRLSVLRELEVLHARLNSVIISPAIEEIEDTKENYVAGDVGSAANIATALNTIAGKVNDISSALNSILEKINKS